MLNIQFMLADSWQDRDGTFFLSCWCCSIDRLASWDVTYFVCCKSADTWGFAHLYVALEWVVYDGDMIGCIVAPMVLTEWFYQYVVAGLWCLIWPHSCLLFRICNSYADWGSLRFVYLICSWYLCFKVRLACPIYDIWHILHVSS